MDERTIERYIRWSDHRITQQSFTLNLFLTFSVACLAYAINLKITGTAPDGINLKSTIYLWSCSAFIGCMATMSKLLDYRHTARKIKDGGRFNSFMAKRCGQFTWGALWAQVTPLHGELMFLFPAFSHEKAVFRLRLVRLFCRRSRSTKIVSIFMKSQVEWIYKF